MITVHHLNNSRSQRVLWALEELGLDYTIKSYERDKQTMLAPPELRDVHPLGLSPVVEHNSDDGAAIRVAESGAILEYLADLTGNLRPESPADRRMCTYWLHYAEGTLMPVLLLKLIMNRISGRA